MSDEAKSRLKYILLAIVIIVVIIFLSLGLNGCAEVESVNYNIKQDADNFKIRRRVVALNTRTNEPLFSVEGYISLNTDVDGDLNVTIKTGRDSYKLFYAHLSKDVTYTSIQLDDVKADPYAYDIQFFPAKEVIEHGIVNIKSTEDSNESQKDYTTEVSGTAVK